jgi:hypothetical protein
VADFNSEDHRLEDSIAPPASYAAEQLVRDPPLMSGVVSFLSSTEREGRWQLPRKFRALAVMGNVELDLREADVGYGVSVIEAVAFMGNIEVTIPPEIAVECDGDSLMGIFTLKYRGGANPAAASRDRTVRVIGSAYMGSVSVNVKGPDEAMFAKIGRKLGIGRR